MRPIAGIAALLLGVAFGAVQSGTATAAPSPTGEFNYAEALQGSMLFYESQRSGRLPADNRVSWRGDSDLTDGADHGLDLTGGYHDAGDEVKFGLPGAYSMTTLAWGGLASPSGYTKAAQTDYLKRNLKWGTDYLIKAHPSPHVFYGQVGDGGSDHAFWGSPEVNPSPRPSYAVTESCPGSDLTGESAAALASTYLLFKSSDPTYAATLLSHAKSLYEFAESFKGKYDACITAAGGFYNSWSGYADELTWGAIWLYKATGDASYLTKARTYYATMNKMQQTTTPEFNWTINWDDKSFGAYVLMAELTNEQQFITDAERNLDWFTTGVNGSHVNMTPGGEAVVDVWGTARYAANAAFLALEFSKWLTSKGLDPTRAQTYHDFGVRQINYILGDNPNHLSYLVGFTNGGRNTAWPRNPHSRAAHGSWSNNIQEPPNNRHQAIGELVGGPNSAGSDAFSDDRGNYQQNEGALDYNSLFSGALALLTDQYGGTPLANFPVKETPDGPELFMQGAVNAVGSNFIEIKAMVNNKTAWPARSLTSASFRYYFTLDPGVLPSQVVLASPYNQCTAPTGPTQFSGSTYFVTISCAGTRIAPSGQSDFHKEVQFRLSFPVAHDPTRDWSYSGIATTPGATPVNAPNIVLFDGSTQVWGALPSGGGGGTVTAPSAPGTPSASGITATGATLTWAASTPGTNPIAGYDVYQVGGAKLASATGTSVTLTGLTPSSVYSVQVVARDTVGTQSSPSPSASFTTVGSGGGSGGTCKVTYARASEWGGGFTANVTVANTGTTAINGWTLTFSFPGDQHVTSSWNTRLTQSGAAVTARDAGYNAAVPAAGSVAFGFQGTWSASDASPTAFALNGTPCTTG
jgi:endoglucanase